MARKNSSDKRTSQSIWEREHQRALRIQRVLRTVVALAVIAIVGFVGYGGMRIYSGLSTPSTTDGTPIAEIITQVPSPSALPADTPTPKSDTPPPVPAATSTPTITALATDTPTNTPKPFVTDTPTSTPSATATPTNSPTQIIGVVENAVNLFNYPDATTLLTEFEWNGQERVSPVHYLKASDVVYLCYMMMIPSSTPRYGVSDEPCSPSATPVGLARVTGFTSPLETEFPATLITPLPTGQ